MYRFKVALILILCLPILSSCKAGAFDFGVEKILILSNGDKESAVAADYLYKHVEKRNLNKKKFEVRRSDLAEVRNNEGTIYIEIVPDLEFDYEIVNEGGKLSIFAKDKSTLKWLSYMLIEYLGNYHQLDRAGLPPNYIDFNTSKVKFAFLYRDPHLQPNMDSDVSGILNTHNVDEDWGLWGHNLRKVFVGKANPKSLALINGQRTTEQFCFSAAETFSAIREFVLDQYGDGRDGGKWFMIAPNDNDIVCTCTTCLKSGNSATSATPAVVNLLNRLAQEFPKHHFYTTAYRTTLAPPTVALQGNTGVLVSTIDLSKAQKLKDSDPSVSSFISLLGKWKQHSSSIYLWDYISNFDDYLSPYPVLMRAKEQFQFFENLGVQGLFLNGSGYDYSPFDDVKTYVLSALMINPHLDVATLVSKYYARFYPVSGELLAEYLLDLENNSAAENKNLGLYMSFREAMKTYLDVNKVKQLYADLLTLKGKLSGDEKERIDKLISALSYVLLQAAYHNGTIDNGFFVINDGKITLSANNEEVLARLKDGVDNKLITVYKEDNGDLATYLKEWYTWQEKVTFINLLQSVKVKSLNSGVVLDESSLLTDNKPGFISDFNQGWFLTGEDIGLEGTFNTTNSSTKGIQITFLLNDRHRMLLPERIEIFSDGQLITQFTKADFFINKNSAQIKKNLNVPTGKKVELKIFKNRELKNSVIACDEIQFY